MFGLITYQKCSGYPKQDENFEFLRDRNWFSTRGGHSLTFFDLSLSFGFELTRRSCSSSLGKRRKRSNFGGWGIGRI